MHFTSFGVSKVVDFTTCSACDVADRAHKFLFALRGKIWKMGETLVCMGYRGLVPISSLSVSIGQRALGLSLLQRNPMTIGLPVIVTVHAGTRGRVPPGRVSAHIRVGIVSAVWSISMHIAPHVQVCRCSLQLSPLVWPLWEYCEAVCK